MSSLAARSVPSAAPTPIHAALGLLTCPCCPRLPRHAPSAVACPLRGKARPAQPLDCAAPHPACASPPPPRSASPPPPASTRTSWPAAHSRDSACKTSIRLGARL
ncbi:hypothetical protein BDY17DRAFT_112816 [Neohortaea acidophila]|uniref:Uncharacterized protein n=1 Tax=Neohortaea acidophila TaxID=245834 RepID=A0A6A6Q2G9_9PEZI|nr:uncharacterized protein BDY17DRAFT_112816 [Neohortaea acidophila]KAF2485863.1 hypothetical protein BDY17DRAFT_112816 [Neohortaea acidophila]